MSTDQDYTREQRSRGGRKAAATNKRNTQGRFVKSEVPLPPGFKIVVPKRDHFTPQPVPQRLEDQRDWPRIQGSKADLDEATAHLHTFAARSGIDISTGPAGKGQAGTYNRKSRTITLAKELDDHPALYAWVLAHELGHALDSRLAALGDEEYGTQEHTGDFELVAEATALRTLSSFGMTIDSTGDHLSTICGKNWKNRLQKTKNRYRYHAAAGKLAKQQHPSDSFAAGVAERNIQRAERAERRRIRQRNRRYADPIKLRWWK